MQFVPQHEQNGAVLPCSVIYNHCPLHCESVVGDDCAHCPLEGGVSLNPPSKLGNIRGQSLVDPSPVGAVVQEEGVVEVLPSVIDLLPMDDSTGAVLTCGC